MIAKTMRTSQNHENLAVFLVFLTRAVVPSSFKNSVATAFERSSAEIRSFKLVLLLFSLVTMTPTLAPFLIL